MQPVRRVRAETGSSEIDTLWQAVAQRIGAREFQQYFAGKTRWTWDSPWLTVWVASGFLRQWLQKQFLTQVAEAVRNVLGDAARVRFSVAAGDEPAGNDGVAPPVAQESRPAGPVRDAVAVSPRPAARTTGRRFADLADFVAGPQSELALAALHQVCQAPGARYNPLFWYGGTGVGKTHLLEGAYRLLRQQAPTASVLFLNGENFTNGFLQAIQEHSLPSFRQRFRGVDVLLLDDLDFLETKRVTQEEFLHTLMQLESQGRQVLVTADRHPRLMTKLSDELRSRLLAGMVCRLEVPDLATRCEIVRRKAQRLGLDACPEALAFIAERFPHSVRELEGAVLTLTNWQAVAKQRVSLAGAKQALGDLERDCLRVVRLPDVARAVCQVFGVTAEELKSAARQRTLSQPRMLAMYLARKHTGAAYHEIGQFFGGRNHSTVISAERKIDEWLSAEHPLRVGAQPWRVVDLLQALEQQLLAG